jgi:hypothetical protein
VAAHRTCSRFGSGTLQLLQLTVAPLVWAAAPVRDSCTQWSDSEGKGSWEARAAYVQESAPDQAGEAAASGGTPPAEPQLGPWSAARPRPYQAEPRCSRPNLRRIKTVKPSILTRRSQDEERGEHGGPHVAMCGTGRRKPWHQFQTGFLRVKTTTREMLKAV